MIISNTHAHSELLQIWVSASQKSLGEVPFFRLQLSQAPGIRRFFEWVSGDAFEASSPFDSVISVRIQVDRSNSMAVREKPYILPVWSSRFPVMTQLPKTDLTGVGV